MNDSNTHVPDLETKTTPAAALWTGRVITGLVGAAFTMSAAMKFTGGDAVEEGMAQLGIPVEILLPLAILELVVTVIYLVPQTAVLGAILLTGYIGGTILAHWRVGDPVIVNVIIGVMIWLGVYLRDRRLWTLMPWRSR